MAYAERTRTPIDKTRLEIERLVIGRGATAFGSFLELEKATIALRLQDRNIQFRLPLPAKMKDQAKMSLWRALLLVIKAKLESVDSGIETVEEAFLSHIVTPTGRTVMEEIREPLKLQYAGKNVPLLPGPGT